MFNREAWSNTEQIYLSSICLLTMSCYPDHHSTAHCIELTFKNKLNPNCPYSHVFWILSSNIAEEQSHGPCQYLFLFCSHLFSGWQGLVTSPNLRPDQKKFQTTWNAARVEHVCYKCLNHLQLGKSAWNDTSIYLMLDWFQYNLRIWSKQRALADGQWTSLLTFVMEMLPLDNTEKEML